MSIEPSWMKVMRVLGRPPWQCLDGWEPGPGAPGDAPATPGAQAARWMTQIDADLAARRITPEEGERRRQAVIHWLARA